MAKIVVGPRTEDRPVSLRVVGVGPPIVSASSRLKNDEMVRAWVISHQEINLSGLMRKLLLEYIEAHP